MSHLPPANAEPMFERFRRMEGGFASRRGGRDLGRAGTGRAQGYPHGPVGHCAVSSPSGSGGALGWVRVWGPPPGPTTSPLVPQFPFR